MNINSLDEKDQLRQAGIDPDVTPLVYYTPPSPHKMCEYNGIQTSDERMGLILQREQTNVLKGQLSALQSITDNLGRMNERHLHVPTYWQSLLERLVRRVEKWRGYYVTEYDDGTRSVYKLPKRYTTLGSVIPFSIFNRKK